MWNTALLKKLKFLSLTRDNSSSVHCSLQNSPTIKSLLNQINLKIYFPSRIYTNTILVFSIDLIHPSDCTIALFSTLPLTEKLPGKSPGGESGRDVKLIFFPPIFGDCLKILEA
jgi:hypothetical protein